MRSEAVWTLGLPPARGVWRTRYMSAGKPASGWRYWDGKYWSNPWTKPAECFEAAQLGRLGRINLTTSRVEYKEKWLPKPTP